MPHQDFDQDGPDTNAAADPSTPMDGYHPLDGSVDLTPPQTGLGNASGVTWHPLNDPALDQHYAGLANQYDPDPPPGLLGTFQRLPPDGIADRWRYTSPNIPGEPMRDDDGNPCAAWLISRRIGNTGYLADHNFVVVADQLGGPITARFSYGPSKWWDGQLVSAADSNNDTDKGDLAAWLQAGQPFTGVHVQQIPASDGAVIKAGQNLNQSLGTVQKPGPIPYWLTPEEWFSGANSNSAAARVVNDAIQQDHPGADPILPYPGSWPFGWNTAPTRR